MRASRIAEVNRALGGTGCSNWPGQPRRLGITRANNQPAIQRAWPNLPNVRFIYYDLPNWLATLKKKAPILQFYYLLWQWGAYRAARQLHRQEQFDLVQHLTLGVFRHPSFMGGLGIPFIFGPVGGGERRRFGYVWTTASRDI